MLSLLVLWPPIAQVLSACQKASPSFAQAVHAYKVPFIRPILLAALEPPGGSLKAGLFGFGGAYQSEVQQLACSSTNSSSTAEPLDVLAERLSLERPPLTWTEIVELLVRGAAGQQQAVLVAHAQAPH
jgi:hypothetical protein